MEQIKPIPKQHKHHIYRKPSSNTSIQSNQSPIVRKKFLMQRKNTLNNNDQDIKNTHNDFGQTRKLKICQGQRLSYEVIKRDSKQKRAEFLQKYAHDPFMRKKFQKSVQKFSRSKSKDLTEKKIAWITPTPEVKCMNQSYTTFRQQIKQQSQKTVKLISNCKMLVEQLKKNRLNDQKKQHQTSIKNIHHSNRFQTRR